MMVSCCQIDQSLGLTTQKMIIFVTAKVDKRVISRILKLYDVISSFKSSKTPSLNFYSLTLETTVKKKKKPQNLYIFLFIIYTHSFEIYFYMFDMYKINSNMRIFQISVETLYKQNRLL